MNSPPPWKPTGRSSLIMLIILIFVLAIGFILAWTKSPPGAPDPTATADPQILHP